MFRVVFPLFQLVRGEVGNVMIASSDMHITTQERLVITRRHMSHATRLAP